MKRTSFDAMNCSIARTLDVIGEWWTPLILRDVFLGVRRFEPLRAHLGISRNILTDRLQTLVTNGILERQLYQDNPPRYEYRPTERGYELQPLIVAVMDWGDRWLGRDNGVETEIVHKPCGKVTKALIVCSECRKPLAPHTMTARRGPTGDPAEWEALKQAALGNAPEEAAPAVTAKRAPRRRRKRVN